MSPEDFARKDNSIKTLTLSELNAYIAKEKKRGAADLVAYEIEKYTRYAMPISTFILILIAVSLSSKKVRGGIGVQIGAGILLSFTYIMFMQVSQTFATNGNMPAILAIWIPNIFFSIVAAYLLRSAMK